MRFRSYHSLKLFDVVARHMSFTAAATELNQSKGSVSYQIGKLEADLGFQLFHRHHPRISLTKKGERLWHASQSALSQLDREISELRGEGPGSVSIGMQTYVLSRWLSPRLTGFVEAHPGVALRIEPVNSLDDIDRSDADMIIVWGNESWFRRGCELLFSCPAVPTASPALAQEIAEIGMEAAMSSLPLLADSSGERGWRAWHAVAGLPYKPRRHALTLPDSNSRVQAVIDGQGIALWDRLVEPEVRAGRLTYASDIWLESCGYYLIYPNGVPDRPEPAAFRDWIVREAANDMDS